MEPDRLFIVVPCYNEQEVLRETARRLVERLGILRDKGLAAASSRILFVDDGSGDATWEMIEALHGDHAEIQGLKLSRNRGHQNALFAGLMAVRHLADVTISMDADLQDDIAAMDAMLEKYRSGADIVYGVRDRRKTDSFFKRATAQSFYKLMGRMGAETVYNHADYRLMSARALAALSSFSEVNLFLRGLVPMVGYPSEIVFYERGERFAGKSKYPLGKMLHFATEGVTSLSVRPIRMITTLGFLIFFVSIATIVYSLVRYFTGQTITGWTTTVLSVWAIGGLIMISLGVIGEYIGKIYLESKHRPRFLIDTYLGDEDETADCTDPANAAARMETV
ncbi:MAG: glycosyltransferase family 2 protein [Lachnospiraceae bacterium]|nr:glycosyltransferase family 2 protein [Lachnospiraceae bacterium]